MTELILALDVTEKKKALSIAHACAPHLDAIKSRVPAYTVLRAFHGTGT